jgi:2-polyprenyl-3-methyl-5-hydroxy-6-metoxy-1,4-benzoquinol methylase
MQQDRSDIPISEEAWEAQYQSGQWKYMADMNQLARYSIIISYMAYLRPGGAVLDVGCGDGVLFERFRPYGYSRYLGIDICGTALTKLIEEQYEKTLFIRADAETYTPDEQFDVIVLNEVVYYFHEPLKTVEKYVHALKKDGILVVSSFTGSERAMSILQKLKAAYSLLDESRIIHEASSKSWICSVFLPILQDE